MKKRRCSKCARPLAAANPGPDCYCHTDGMPVVIRYPATGCTSRYVPPGEGREPSRPLVPGTDRFDQVVYTREVTGVVSGRAVVEIEDFF